MCSSFQTKKKKCVSNKHLLNEHVTKTNSAFDKESVNERHISVVTFKKKQATFADFDTKKLHFSTFYLF